MFASTGRKTEALDRRPILSFAPAAIRKSNLEVKQTIASAAIAVQPLSQSVYLRGILQARRGRETAEQIGIETNDLLAGVDKKRVVPTEILRSELRRNLNGSSLGYTDARAAAGSGHRFQVPSGEPS
jgi:hypothetical protein